MYKCEKVFDKGFALFFFLMNCCSIHLIQLIGKVSKLPTYSKKSGNGAKQNQKKKSAAVSKNSLKINFCLRVSDIFV